MNFIYNLVFNTNGLPTIKLSRGWSCTCPKYARSITTCRGWSCTCPNIHDQSSPVGAGLAPAQIIHDQSPPVGAGLAPAQIIHDQSSPGAGLAPAQTEQKKRIILGVRMKKGSFLFVLIMMSVLFSLSCTKKTTEFALAPSPVINPTGGVYTTAQTVTISCPLAEAEIHYTIDGTDPNYLSELYTAPILVSQSQTIKAIALCSNYMPSTVSSVVYYINSNPYSNLLFVQSGVFEMGDTTAFIDEQPVHSVLLDSYYIGKYEVTQAEWQSVMMGNTNEISVAPSHFIDNPAHPVERVSWYDVLVYCNRRSLQTGLTPCYEKIGDTNPDNWGVVPTSNNAEWNAIVCNMNANGFRLPTEAEWEYAARGGNMSQKYNYSGSNRASDVAWYYNISSGSTKQVGLKGMNYLGTHDMSGNVCEWCWDWDGTYPSNDQTNPLGPTNGSIKIVRGGSWASTAYDCRISGRGSANQSGRFASIGFRVVRRNSLLFFGKRA